MNSVFKKKSASLITQQNQFGRNRMSKPYYQLALKRRRKPPKKVFLDENLATLNSILNTILQNARTMKNHSTTNNIIKNLDKIIPNEYFGTTRHRKLFYQIVKRIMTQSTHECIHRSLITRGYDHKQIPWLNGQTNDNLLRKYNLFILDYVVKPLIAFYYKPIRTYVGHEVRLMERKKWNSFESKAFHKLKKLDYIEETNEGQSRGNLIIVPKGKNFRPIVNIFPDSENQALYKRINGKVYEAARKMKKEAPTSLYENWKSYVERTRDQKIYGVKLDVEDAYGNVNITILCLLITALKTKFLTDAETEFVKNHIQNQYITFRKKVYRWKHGLIQGDHLSSCLCELYMSDLDRIFMLKLKDNWFRDRTVDDYVFCSTEAYEVYNFNMSVVPPINKEKTKTNILHQNNDVIPYCGKLFNLVTKEVKKLYTFNHRYEIRHKFKIWNNQYPISEKKAILFLRRSMTFAYNNNNFTKMELNTVFNSQKTVLENFFEGMVHVAFKFDATVMAVRYLFREDTQFVMEELKNTVNTYAMKVCNKIKKSKGDYYKVKITRQHLKVLSWKAFIVVFKKRNEVYKNVIEEIKNTCNLRLTFNDKVVDYKYFSKLPVMFKDVKLNRNISG